VRLMERIDTRTQLIKYIHNNAPRPAIKTACYRGSVEVLGGFRNIPPSTRSGWIVVITSEFGRVWYVAVMEETGAGWKVGVIKNIPWRNYIGVKNRGFPSIHDGDNPMKACAAKERADVRD